VPTGALGKRAPRQQGAERARMAAAAKAKATVGFWWWPYDELEQSKMSKSNLATAAPAGVVKAETVPGQAAGAVPANDSLEATPARAATEAPPEPPLPPPPPPRALDEDLLPLSKKKKKAKSLLTGFGKVLQPVPRKVVRRETILEFRKAPMPGYEGSSSSASEPPPTVKVFKQGQGRYSARLTSA
jgi:hypothetical protein